MIAISDIQKKYGNEIAMLMLCCRVFLKTEDLSALEQFVHAHTLDWDEVYHLAKVHRIRYIVYETTLPLQSLDLKFKEQLKQAYLNHSVRAFRCQQKAHQLVALMQQHQIPIQVYKGIHLSQQLYNHLSLREFSDIDFIVNEEDIPRLVAMLKTAGYKVEGATLFEDSEEKYLKHQKDVICYDDSPEGFFLYEFHYKPVGSYLATNISFNDLFAPSWQVGKDLSLCEYLPLLTVNHGLVDRYPTLRCMIDIALLTQKCKQSTCYRLPQLLSGYYSLNAYIIEKLFSVQATEYPAYPDTRFITQQGEQIIQWLLKKKEAGRVPLSAIIKVAYRLRSGLFEKIKLVKAVVKYILTPNYNDTTNAQQQPKWMYVLSRPIRLLQHLKRYI